MAAPSSAGLRPGFPGRRRETSSVWFVLVCLMDVLFCFHTILVLVFLFIPPFMVVPT